MKTRLTVREMTLADVPGCTDILNDIIARGEGTAHEDPMSEAMVAQHYLTDPVTRHVVLYRTRLLGFQCAFDDGTDALDIGTFTDRRDPVRGAGRALFSATLSAVRARGARAIKARIAADNAAGLAYYSAIGFHDEAVIPADVHRRDGRIVDRIVKRYDL